mgnify:CR=1 FL=1
MVSRRYFAEHEFSKGNGLPFISHHTRSSSPPNNRRSTPPRPGRCRLFFGGSTNSSLAKDTNTAEKTVRRYDMLSPLSPFRISGNVCRNVLRWYPAGRNNMTTNILAGVHLIGRPSQGYGRYHLIHPTTIVPDLNLTNLSVPEIGSGINSVSTVRREIVTDDVLYKRYLHNKPVERMQI